MKARFLALAALLFGLAACQTEPEGFDVNLGGEQEVMLTVSLPEATRADSAEGFDLGSLATTDYSLRYILEIYRVDGENVVYDTCQRFVKTSDFTTMAFPVKLVPGRNYRIVAWADIVVGDSEDDRYYDTQEGLDNVVIKDNGTVNWNPMDETRDAYTGTQLVENFNSSTNIPNMTLTRPFAKLRVVSTDIEEVRKLGIEPASAVATYSQPMYYKYNALTATAFDAQTQTKSHTFEYATTASKYEDKVGELTLFTDYIFVPKDKVAKFSLNVVDIKENHFNTDIFVQRNTLTTIKGDVLTLGENIVVNVDGTITEGDTHAVVNSAEDLQQMINNAPANENTNITLGGDIDLGDLLAASTLSTRANETASLVIPAGKSVILDLNGYTISQSKECTDSYSMILNNGELTITGEGTIEFTNTAEGGSSTWGTYTIENRGEGVLTIDNVTIRHNGCVNGETNRDTNIAIQNYQGKVVVNEGTISSPQFRSLRDFTAGGEIIINGGTFLGQVWMQGLGNGPSSLTINGGNFSPVAGYDGSSVYITNSGNIVNVAVNGGMFNTKIGCYDATKEGAKGCIVGGSFTATAKENTAAALINDDYAWKQMGNDWTLVRKPDVAKIGEVGYTTLDKAVDAAKNGDTITFVADVEQVDGVLITDKNITIDLNDKTFTVSEGASTNNRNFKVNGNSVVTIKNGTMIAEGQLTSGAYGTVRTEDKAVVTLENVKLYSYRGYGLNVKANTGSTIYINNSEIYSQYSGGVEAAGGTIELTDVMIQQKGVYSGAAWCSVAIGVNGNGKVTVNSGDYSASAISTDTNAAQGTWVAYVMSSGGTLDIKGGTFNGVVAETAAAANACGIICADRAAVVDIYGGTFNSNGAILDMRNNVGTQPNPIATLYGGTFSADPRVSGLYSSNLIKVADGYITSKNDNGTYTVMSSTLEDGAVLDLGGVEYNDAITALGDLTIKGDTKIKTLKAVNGGTITIEDGKTLTLTNFSFGSKDTANAEYEIKGGTIVASCGFFQHGKYTLRSNFETGYMYYSYGSDITVYGTFHSQGKGDGLDYVRGKLTIAEGGKSIHDKSLWVGQPASWGAMNASLVIEAGGYVQANSLSVYEGSSLTYSNDADLKYNSLTGTEYITKK